MVQFSINVYRVYGAVEGNLGEWRAKVNQNKVRVLVYEGEQS